MRRTFLLKSMLLLCALVAGSSSVWAANGDVKVTINYGDIPSGYASTGTSGSISKTVKTSNDLTINYAGINTKSSASATTSYSYAMFVKNNGYVYSSVAPTGYYPSKVTVTFGSGTGTSGKAGVTYGTSALTTRNSSVTGSVSQSGTCELTNTDQTKLYWNFSTTGANVQVDKIEVTYSLKGAVNPPTFSPAAGEVVKGSTVTLTQADADQIRYTLDGSAPTKTTGTVYSAPIVINEPTTIKAIAIKGDEISGVTEASYTVVYPAVLTLDFTDADWGFPSDDYVKTEKFYTNNGYTVTLGEAGTGHKVVMESGSSTKIASLIFGKKDATLTLPALGFNVSKLKVYGNSSASGAVTFNVYVGTTAVSTEVTSSKVTQEFTIAADKQDVGTIYTIKVTNANNCQISKIEVFGNGCEAREVTSFGWATYVAQNDMKFPAGRAYVVTNASVGNAITKAEVTDVPAGTPVLLKDEGAVTAMLLDAAPAAPATNMLSVCDGTIASGKYAYVLAKNGTSAGFKQWTGEAADLTNRVVMLLDEAAEAPSFIPLDGETTGINTVNGSGFMVNGSEVYNLNGQRVAQPTKGLYIVNGRKVVIK
jgi:hypothetical protein